MQLRIALCLTVFCFVSSIECNGSCNYLRVLEGCACAGSNVTFECAVSGPGLTIWELGECCSVALPHSNVNESRSCTSTCKAYGQGKVIKDGCYISTFVIEMTSQLTGEAVICSLEYDEIVLIGNMTLTSIPRPGDIVVPSNVRINASNSTDLFITWEPVEVTNCPSVVYTISATKDCINCPGSVSENIVECMILSEEVTCNFSVSTDICGIINSAHMTISINTVTTPSTTAVSELHGIIGGTFAGLVVLFAIVMITIVSCVMKSKKGGYQVVRREDIPLPAVNEHSTANSGLGTSESPTDVQVNFEEGYEVTGEGLESAEVGATASVSLTVCGLQNENIKKKISANLSSSYNCVYTSTECNVERINNKKYEIRYQPQSHGRYTLNIQVGGKPVKGNPFSVRVTLPIEKLRNRTATRQITGLNKPCGVAFANNRLIIAEEGSSRLSFYTTCGGRLKYFTIQGQKAKNLSQTISPRGVAIDFAGNILATDGKNHCVLVFTPDGTFTRAVGQKGSQELQFDEPMGIGAHPSTKEVFVADHKNDRIQILSPDLTFKDYLGSGKTNSSEQLKKPWSVAFDSAENIYVVDSGNHRIQVYDTEKKHIKSFGSEGQDEGLLYWPTYIYIDGDLVYVGEDGNHRVSIFNCEGKFVASFGNSAGQFSLPHGITMDSGGHIYVCDNDKNCIQVF